ncbi:hypothetical protein BJ546DRAFT_31588 [Cryomyces antarcticus]
MKTLVATMLSRKAPWTSRDLHALAEDTTLLYLVCKEPAPPAVHPLPTSQTTNKARHGSFSLKQEHELVDNLAFLSAHSDDAEKVTAVCVEEQVDGNGLTIRVASNTGVSTALKEGFDRLARLLEGIAKQREVTTDCSALLSAIFALDRARILCRLRSKHAPSSRKVKNKPAIIPRLHDAMAILSRKAMLSVSKSELNEVKAQVDRMCSLFTSLECLSTSHARTSMSDKILASLCEHAYRLASRHSLEKIFSKLPNAEGFQQNNKTSIVTAVCKVGRYRSICDFLIAAARRRPNAFQSIEVDVIRLPPSNTWSQPYLPPWHSLWETLTRSMPTQSATERQTAQCLKRHVGSESEARFQALLAPKTFKVHAEIQLLFYYELHPEKNRPRVICSSKSACFLCDLFFRLHGQFHVARTHGKIYEKWTLPDLGTTATSSMSSSRIEFLAGVFQQFDCHQR